jgi:phage shock protein C
MADRLFRSTEDRMLAGVAAGVADALDADPSIVRVTWAVLVVLTGGLALLVYIVMAIVVPEGHPLAASDAGTTAATEAQPGAPSAWTAEREARRAARRARRAEGNGQAGLVIGLVLIVVGGIFLLRQLGIFFAWDLWWPIGLIAIGVLLLVLALTPRRTG